MLHMSHNSIYNGLAGGVRLCCIDYQELSQEVRHSHDFFELVFVLDGSGLHITDSGRQEIRRGDVFLLRPDLPHEYQEIRHLKLANIVFLPEKLSLPLQKFRNLPGYAFVFESKLADHHTMIHLSEEDLSAVITIIHAMTKEQEKEEPGFDIALNALFLELVLLVARRAADVAGNTPEELPDLRPFCEKMLPQGLSVTILAEHYARSPRSLERIIRRKTGLTPIEFILKFKFEHATHLLLSSDLRIATIAVKSGFQNAEYFSRIFRQRYLLSPKIWRARFRCSFR